MLEIDCRDKACPQPVIMTKDALAQLKDGELTIIVDNPSSSKNVEQFARSQGCLVDVEKRGPDFYLHIQKVKLNDEGKLSKKKEKVVVYINSHLLGIGDEALHLFEENGISIVKCYTRDQRGKLGKGDGNIPFG